MQGKTNCCTTRQRPRVTLYAIHDAVSTLQWVVRLSCAGSCSLPGFQLIYVYSATSCSFNIPSLPKSEAFVHIFLCKTKSYLSTP